MNEKLTRQNLHRDETERLFGSKLEYKRGDIVVWRGAYPAICRIKRRCKVEIGIYDTECAVSTSDTHDSLHYSHLRLANEAEKEQLGKKKILILSKY